ncbi:hypothetical protein [Novosphingobium sp.]|uniref:hypothetical protein n=1 Tax=Novosphingobium sp. TaxID=1874826 RepID=UPI003BAB6848
MANDRTTVMHRRHTIIARKSGNAWEGRAFRGKAPATQVRTAATSDDVVTQVCADLDQEAARERASRGVDGYVRRVFGDLACYRFFDEGTFALSRIDADYDILILDAANPTRMARYLRVNRALLRIVAKFVIMPDSSPPRRARMLAAGRARAQFRSGTVRRLEHFPPNLGQRDGADFGRVQGSRRAPCCRMETDERRRSQPALWPPGSKQCASGRLRRLWQSNRHSSASVAPSSTVGVGGRVRERA